MKPPDTLFEASCSDMRSEKLLKGCPGVSTLEILGNFGKFGAIKNIN